MIRAWRLIKAEHADDAFAGEGAIRSGSRWNSKGVRVEKVVILSPQKFALARGFLKYMRESNNP
jgi:hypothetical protein